MLLSTSIWGSHWLAGMLLNTTPKIWTMPKHGKQSWNISYSVAVEHNLPEHVTRGAGPGSVFHSLEQERQSDVLQLSLTFKNHERAVIVQQISSSLDIFQVVCGGRGALRLQIFSDSVERGQKGFARQMVIYGSSIDHILTDAEYNRDISRSLQLKLTRQIKANINNYGGHSGGHLVKSTRGFWTPRQLLRV